MNTFLKPFEEKMESTIEYLTDEFRTIRTGRANPGILDRVMVDYYGQSTPLNQLASISVPEARMLVIQPFDVNSMAEIERAIIEADLGLNPSNDGKIIRIVIPSPTEDRRKELVKQVNKLGEDGKVVIRNTRREAVDEAKRLEKEEGYSEDDRRKMEEDIQQLTNKYTDQIDEMCKNKSNEVMEV